MQTQPQIIESQATNETPSPEAVVRRLLDEGFTRGRLEVADELVAEDALEPPRAFLAAPPSEAPASVRAMRAGAVDFLEKPVAREPLLAAVREALARDAEARASGERLRALRARYATLTPREREVFAGVVAGRLNKQIAADIGAAERTVKAHRAQVLAKMGVGSVAELSRLATEMGLVPGAPSGSTDG